VAPVMAQLAERTTTLFGVHLERLVEARDRMRVLDERTDFFLA